MRSARLALATLATLTLTGATGCAATGDDGDEVGATEGAATTVECAENGEGIPSCLAAQLPATTKRLAFSAVVRATGEGTWSVGYDLVVPAYKNAQGQAVPERRTAVTSACTGRFAAPFSSRITCTTSPATGTAYYARTSVSFPNSFRYVSGDDVRAVPAGRPTDTFEIAGASANLTRTVTLPETGSFTLSGVVNAYAAGGAWIASMDCPSAVFGAASATRTEAPYTCSAYRFPSAAKYVFTIASSGASFPETR